MNIVDGATGYHTSVCRFRAMGVARAGFGEDGLVNVGSGPHLVEIVAALKEITAGLSTATALPAALDDLVKVTTDLLPTDISCGVTLVGQGEPATFAASGLAAEVLDESRHADGDGPDAGRDAGPGHRPGPVPRPTSRDGRRGGPRRSGTACTASSRTRSTSTRSPSAPSPCTPGGCEAFTGDVPIVAMLVADHASLLLRVRLPPARRGRAAGRAADRGAGGDVAVERAVGIVMAQRGCPPEQALRHLHDAATHLGVGLPAVAERLVRSVSDRGSPA